ncbi:MAG: glycosyltransferase family 4 protein [Flavobacteriales bacterium]|nr:glycosyltransferase family 4 protein [Flavobacteriales bacterium]
MKRVGILLGDAQGNGGIGRVTWILSNRLCENFDIYILSDFHNPKIKYDYDQRIHFSYLTDNMTSVHKRILSVAKGIKKFIKENKIDVFICAGAIYFPPATLAVKGTHAKFICWEHSNVSVKNEHRFQGICRWFGAKFADWIVPLTKTDAKLYQKEYGCKHITSIYNPVDDKLLTSVSYNTESKKIISVGRFCWQKNFEILVEVAKIVLAKNPDWSWDIFGDGETFETVQMLVAENHLEGRLNLMGRVNDLYDRYREYSMLVMTSRFEGFPMTLLESTAQGIPAVAFDVLTGPNEVIDDGASGFLVEPDNIKQMADKIQKLIDTPQMRVAMSHACVAKRDNYNCETIVGEWNKLIDSVAIL